MSIESHKKCPNSRIFIKNVMKTTISVINLKQNRKESHRLSEIIDLEKINITRAQFICM